LVIEICLYYDARPKTRQIIETHINFHLFTDTKFSIRVMS